MDVTINFRDLDYLHTNAQIANVLALSRPGFEPARFARKSNALTTRPCDFGQNGCHHQLQRPRLPTFQCSKVTSFNIAPAGVRTRTYQSVVYRSNHSAMRRRSKWMSPSTLATSITYILMLKSRVRLSFFFKKTLKKTWFLF